MNTNRTHYRCIRIFFILNLFYLFYTSGFTQLSGIKTIPGDYSTIASAVADLNGQGVGAGGVTFNIAAGHTEVAPVGGIVLTATGTFANQIVFKKSGIGANPLINAYVGVATPTTSATDGIFILSGSDYVTIDGIDLFDGNTSNPTEMMECGYGLFKIDGTNGSQDNTIKNCKITLNRNSNAGWLSPGHNGSCAIVMHNSTYAAKSSLTVTSASGSNSRNKFYSNKIENCNAGIVFIGFAALSPFTLADTLNDIGGNLLSTGNTILNFGGAVAATNPSAGIHVNNQWGLNVSYNTLDNNNGSGINHGSTLRGIYLSTSSTSASANCNFNNVIIRGGGTTSQVSAIENSFGSTAAGNIININNNTISAEYLTATSGALYGIYNTATTALTVNINNNEVSNFNYSAVSLSGSGAVYGIYSTAVVTNLNALSNTVSDFSRIGTSGGTTIGIYVSSGTNQTVKKNLVENLSIDGTGSTSTMYGIQVAGTTVVCDSNTINNLNCLKTSGSSAMYGIYNISSPNNENYNYNTISNLTHLGTGIVYGLYNFTTTGVRTVSFNLISELKSNGTTVGGINQLSSIPQIFNNKIFNLQSTSVGSPTVFGIQITSSAGTGASAIYNNLIGNLQAPNANTSSATSPSIRGINFTSSSTATYNVSYNTVYINATSFGTNFGTTALFHTTSATATVATLNLNNNNFVNLSNPKGTGRTVAYQRSSTVLTNYGSGSNRNNFYAGGTCVNRLIFFDGTNSDSTLSNFKTRVAAREANSISESPFFLSTLGSSSNFLHLDPTEATLLESGGGNIAGITVDFDGNTRNASTPDLGADEFAGISAAVCSGTPVAGTIIASTNPMCTGKSVMLCTTGQSMNSGLSYSWKSSLNPSGPFTIIPCANDKCLNTDTLTTGLYYYQLMVTCSVSGMMATTPTYTVTVNGSPAVSITPNNPTICLGSSVSLTASGGVSYNWSPASGLNTTSGATVIASPTSDTTYTVTVTDAGGCTNTKSVSVSVTIAATVAASANPDTICAGNNSKLTATPTLPIDPYALSNISGLTYTTLSGAGVTIINTNAQLTPGFGSSTQDDGGIVVNIPFTFNYFGNTFTKMSMCTNGWVAAGDYGTISAIDSRVLNNFFSTTVPNNTIAAWFKDMGANFPLGAGSMRHGLIGTDIYAFQWDKANGSGFSDGSTILISFQVNIYGPASVSPGKVEIIYGPTVGSISFSAAIGIENGIGGSGNFLNALNGSNTSTITSTSWPGNGNGYEFVPLTVTGYQWSPITYLDDPNIMMPMANGVTATTNYTVTVTSSNGCTNTSSVTLLVSPEIATTIEESSGIPNDGIICSGSSVTIAASGGGTYLWSSGETSSTITKTPGVTTTYTVTVTAVDGCIGTKAVIITVNPTPNVSILPLPAMVCIGNSITLIASGGGSYLWNTGETSSSITKSPISNTTYTVSVTSTEGCTASLSRLVTVNTLPVASITPVSANICSGSSINLTASGGTAYSWSTGENSSTISVSPLINTNYTVTVTNAEGCSATASRTVSVLAQHSLSNTKIEPSTCTSSDGSINLTVTGGLFPFTFSWTGPGGFTANTEDISGLKIGAYNVTVTGNNGCIATGSVVLIGPGTCSSGTISISDPCRCKNNATTLQNGQFDEQIMVTAGSGQSWTVTSVIGLYQTSSPPPPAAPILISLGTPLVETPAGSGVYLLNGVHIDSIGYTISVSNGQGVLTIGNTCYYPNPTFMNLDTAYCKSAPAVTLMAKGFLGNGTNAAVGGTTTFMINGQPGTQLDPLILNVGSHIVMGNFDADSVNVLNPGCIQKMTQNVQINALGTVNPTRDTNTCHGRLHPGYVFSGTPLGSVSFNWRKTSATGGQATTIASSGIGNIPGFTATNASNCNLLTDTVFVTPVNNRGNCVGGVDTFLIRTAVMPTATQIRDSSFCDGNMWTPPSFSGNCTVQTTFRWVKKPGPGGTQLPALPLSGTGNLPKLTIVNPPPSCLILTDTIIVTPVYVIQGTSDSCVGVQMKFIVKSVPTPIVNATRDTTLCANTNPSGFNLFSNCSITTQRWRKTSVGGPSNSGTSIAVLGNGNIPPFTTNNPTNTIRTDTIFVLSVFVSVGDSCVSKPDTFLIHVLPIATATQIRDTTYCSGINVPQLNFAGSYNGVGIKYNWSRTGVSIGTMPLNGMDFIPAWTTMNLTNLPVIETITVVPLIMLNGVNCSGPPMIYRVTIRPAPRAVCRNATIYLDNKGNVILDPTIIDGGSVGGTLTAAPNNFSCRNLGANTVLLTVTDPCGLTNTCSATVTVLDTISPIISCKDVNINLQPGDCQGRIYYIPTASDNCTVSMVIAEDTSKYGSGKFIDKGVHTVCYMAMDQSGNTSRCCSKITVVPYQGATNALACVDEIQLSLDQNCSVTVRPEMVLDGGPYKCYDEYVVRIQLWSGGPFIDRDPNLPGIQLDRRDIGGEFKISIIDSATGNSCWGKATVEDKWAPLILCAPTVTISCVIAPTPANTGIPSVIENCSSYSLTYRDDATQGSCALGYQESIVRTWTAVDGYNNRSTCVQNIIVRLGDIFDVEVPRNYDNIDLPMLNCNEKIDRNKNISQHMSDFPECVDGYILDSVYWLANTNQPNVYPNRRLPRILGWNCLDDTAKLATYGHPSPEPVYYPQHRQWSPSNPLCWGPNTHIMWIGTGKPSGAGVCRNLNMVYDDVTVNTATEGCDAGEIGCYKVLRQWTVLDWCTGVIAGHNQIIKVGDSEGPQVIYPDSARVNMESYACLGRWEVPTPWLLDNCSNELHYSVEVEDGTVTGNEKDGFIVLNLPEGLQTAYVVATDCCGNITKKRVTLNVVDRVPPTAICRTYTTVSILGNQSPNENFAKLFAKDLDEGSYDNCQPHVWFKMIRMSELIGTNNGSNANNVVACQGINGDDNIILTGNQIYFDDFAYFCCADVGQKVIVVLRVFDVDPGIGPINPTRMTNTNSPLNGKFSDCMVEVEVQNKSVPTIIPPPNIVVSCWFWFDINNITNPNDATFGKVVNDLSARRKVVTNDIVCHKYCDRNQLTQYPGYVQTNANPKPAPNQACDFYNAYFDTAHWDRKYELVWGFDGYVLNSCGNPTPTITVNDLRECGQGQIQRVISITGPNNINVSAIQTIWVVDCDPFYIDDETCNDPRFTDLLWPNGVCTQTPVTIEGCGGDVSPENPQLGKPQIVNNADDNCALISIEYRDERFDIEPDACYKILRTWNVIDWCQYDPFIDPDRGRWTALQVIKVRDRNKPEVECEIGECEPATINPKAGICYGHINLTAQATDNCTPADWLLWEYKIDINNDGKGVHGNYDTRVGSLTLKQKLAGDTVEYSHNPYADDRHDPFNASGNYPIGTHKICWFVEDGCGNLDAECKLFTIRDCKAPTPYCANGIITVPMPTTGCIDIWATDLDRGSFDNCTPKNRLKFYFNGDTSQSFIRICCDDFVEQKVNDELIFEVELWVEDEEGNKDYCKTTIIVFDNKLCPDVGSATGTISGQMMTEKNEEANPVEVRLYMNGQMILQRQGSPYSFGNLDLKSQYIVEPKRNDDHLNGVSTQDIVAIQKHILGKTELITPYKLLAADVNDSKGVSSADIAEIRKLILGIIPEFSKVNSWTFVPSAYKFVNAKEPFNAPRTDNVKFDQTKQSETKSISFMAIKMGDVTDNARANGFVKTQNRANSTLKFEIEEQQAAADQEVRVSFTSSNFINLEGFQFTLKYDQKSLEYVGFESGMIQLDPSNFGTTHQGRGILTTSWNSNKSESIDKGKALFTLIFKTRNTVKVSQSVAINSEITAAQAYNSNQEVLNIELVVKKKDQILQSGIFELYQNEPNPFNKQTTISFSLPKPGQVTLTIYDITGKILRVYNLIGQQGMNQFELAKSELSSRGIMYYQLDADNNTATKKMVIID